MGWIPPAWGVVGQILPPELTLAQPLLSFPQKQL